MTILVISMVVFVMARATGDPVTLLASDKATAQDIALLKQQLGLDQPLPMQYWVFITTRYAAIWASHSRTRATSPS